MGLRRSGAVTTACNMLARYAEHAYLRQLRDGSLGTGFVDANCR